MKICVIGINFPPELTGCAPYTEDLIKMLSDSGHQVEVITGLPHYPEWVVPAKFRGRMRRGEIYFGVPLTRLWHYVPKTDSLFGRALYEMSFGIHLRIYVSKKCVDNVIVVTPSLLSIFSANYLKKRGANSKVLVQDIFSSAIMQAGYKSTKLIKVLITHLEGHLMRKMDSVAVVSESFIEKITNLGVPKSRITFSSNYILPDLLMNNEIGDKGEWGWSSEKKNVLYSGNLGKKQDLNNLISAARLLQQKSDDIFFSIFGSGNQKKLLLDKSQNLQNLEIRNLVRNQDYMRLLRSSDLLIVHESTEIEDMSISSKLTSYRASGVPILVVCSISSPTYSEARKFGLEHCEAGNPSLLAQRIIELIHSPDRKSSGISNELELRKARLDWCLMND
jgi:colanic acid biosynthesis glycosyl transferase WcaI